VGEGHRVRYSFAPVRAPDAPAVGSGGGARIGLARTRQAVGAPRCGRLDRSRHGT